MKKLLATTAMLATLVSTEALAACFTPPNTLDAFLPAANQVVCTKVGAVGSMGVYSCPGLKAGITAPNSYSKTQVNVIGETNLSWQAFQKATIAPECSGNSTVITTAQNWWNSNIRDPYFNPLMK